MRAHCDTETDSLTLILADSPVVESDEDRPATILDYDAAANQTSIEIPDASRRVALPTQIEYEVVSAGT